MDFLQGNYWYSEDFLIRKHARMGNKIIQKFVNSLYLRLVNQFFKSSLSHCHLRIGRFYYRIVASVNRWFRAWRWRGIAIKGSKPSIGLRNVNGFCLVNNATKKPEWAQFFIIIEILTLHGQLETTMREGSSKTKGKGKKKYAAEETVAPTGKKSNAEISSLSRHNLSHLISSLFVEPDDDGEQEASNY